MKKTYLICRLSTIYKVTANNRTACIKRFFDYLGVPNEIPFKIISWKDNKVDFDVEIPHGLPFKFLTCSEGDGAVDVVIPEKRWYYYVSHIRGEYVNGYIKAMNFSDSWRQFCKCFKLGHPRYYIDESNDVIVENNPSVSFVCRDFIPDTEVQSYYKILN